MLWDRVFAVNVKGTYLWVHELLPHMIALGSGSIVTVGSQLAVSNMGNYAAYIASKGCDRFPHQDHGGRPRQDGIRVNALIPGVIETARPQRSLARYAEESMRARWAVRQAGGGRTRGALPRKRRFILHGRKPSLRRWRMVGDLIRSRQIFTRAKALPPTSNKG